jgi:hypothetical protein
MFFVLFAGSAVLMIWGLWYIRNNADKGHYPDRELDRKALKIVPHDLLREWRWLTGYIEKYFAIDFTNFSYAQRCKAQTWYDRCDPKSSGLWYATFVMLVIIILEYPILFFELTLAIAGFMNVSPFSNPICYLIPVLILALPALCSFASIIARIIIWWGIVGFYLHKEFRKLVVSEDWQYTKKRLNELLKEKPYFWRYYYIWRSELRRYFSNLEDFYYHGKKKILKPDKRK